MQICWGGGLRSIAGHLANSIAIGNPADGYYVLQAVRESGGWGESVTN